MYQVPFIGTVDRRKIYAFYDISSYFCYRIVINHQKGLMGAHKIFDSVALPHCTSTYLFSCSILEAVINEAPSSNNV